MDDKVIVTHKAALTTKYGTQGFGAILKAISTLVDSDRKRGIKTRVIYLDDAKVMKKLGAKRLDGVKNCRAAKVAIDGVCKALMPDYLMILGAPDVVPHQDLKNPAYAAGDDDDSTAWGDLPYASDAPYGRDPAAFVGPTRVVGRVPDLTGASKPAHLVKLLRTAARWKSRPPSEYSAFFGLSASVWQGSTRLSLENIFGSSKGLLLAPPKGPKYPGGQLRARMHFINCHGAIAEPEFYGQKGEKYPVSLTTGGITGAIPEGAVASVECCYGGELYDDSTLGIDIPICQSYLQQGAYGYMGSSTIAYGPADDNGAADLICQYFLLNVLGGASTGRAALMARQQFVQQTAQMDPIDLKTLAQFCLYGDPSVHPVVMPEPKTGPRGETFEATENFRRGERRAKLRATGEFLKETKPTASKLLKGGKTPVAAKSTLANLAAKGGLPRSQKFVAFKVKGVEPARSGYAKVASAPSRYYLAIGTPRTTMDECDGYWVAVVAKEAGGRIIDYRIYYER